LKNVAGSEVVRVEVADGQGTKFVDALREFDWITAIEFDGHELRLSVVGGERRIPHVLTVASQTGTSITSIELIKPSLEDAFLYYTGKTIREEEGSMQDLMRTRMRRRR